MNSFTKDRLYKEVAQRMLDDFSKGQYAVGDRLPAERELAIEYEVSRPTVREAVIALEVQGIVEVRLGSGAYLKKNARWQRRGRVRYQRVRID